MAAHLMCSAQRRGVILTRPLPLPVAQVRKFAAMRPRFGDRDPIAFAGKHRLFERQHLPAVRAIFRRRNAPTPRPERSRSARHADRQIQSGYRDIAPPDPAAGAPASGAGIWTARLASATGWPWAHALHRWIWLRIGRGHGEALRHGMRPASVNTSRDPVHSSSRTPSKVAKVLIRRRIALWTSIRSLAARVKLK